MEFLQELYQRSAPLCIFGWICLAGTVFSGIMTSQSDTKVLGINAWIKPLKFYLSTFIFTWSMAWFVGYLSQNGIVRTYTWITIAVLTFELGYISLQAARGQRSHFNLSSSYHGMMFSLMGIAISLMTLYTAYIGYLFFADSFPQLPAAYVWGIRLGITLFVLFAFEGGLMGTRLAHTVGAPDGGPGLKFLNWSITHGDLRIAHFVGMHALQVLPLAGFYLFSSPRWVILLGAFYFLLALGVMIQALRGIPLIRA